MCSRLAAICRHLPNGLSLDPLAAIAYRFLDCCSPEYDHVICGRALPVAVWSIVLCLFTTQQTRLQPVFLGLRRMKCAVLVRNGQRWSRLRRRRG